MTGVILVRDNIDVLGRRIVSDGDSVPADELGRRFVRALIERGAAAQVQARTAPPETTEHKHEPEKK